MISVVDGRNGEGRRTITQVDESEVRRELRVSHIFADLPTTKSFSPVPLFSTRKSCSVTVLMRNTPPKKVFHPPGPRQSISPSLARRWITNFCIGEGEEGGGRIGCWTPAFSLAHSLLSFSFRKLEWRSLECTMLYIGAFVIFHFNFSRWLFTRDISCFFLFCKLCIHYRLINKFWCTRFNENLRYTRWYISYTRSEIFFFFFFFYSTRKSLWGDKNQSFVFFTNTILPGNFLSFFFFKVDIAARNIL